MEEQDQLQTLKQTVEQACAAALADTDGDKDSAFQALAIETIRMAPEHPGKPRHFIDLLLGMAIILGPRTRLVVDAQVLMAVVIPSVRELAQQWLEKDQLDAGTCGFIMGLKIPPADLTGAIDSLAKGFEASTDKKNLHVFSQAVHLMGDLPYRAFARGSIEHFGAYMTIPKDEIAKHHGGDLPGFPA